MEKLGIRTVIKYFFKKGMPPKELHEDFMETLGKESPTFHSEKWAAGFKRGKESIEDGERSTSNMSPLMKMSRSCTPWLCVIGGETCEA